MSVYLIVNNVGIQSPRLRPVQLIWAQASHFHTTDTRSDIIRLLFLLQRYYELLYSFFCNALQQWQLLGLDIVKTNILTKFHQNRVANVASRVLTRLSLDLTRWPSFDQTWLIFELGKDIVKTNILTKFHQNRVGNVASRV